MTATINGADGKNIWLRLFGGDAVGGKVKAASRRMVHLDKPRKIDYPEGSAAGSFDTDRIAAARLYPKRRMPKSFRGPEIGVWLNETAFADHPPQLWDSLCPNCINAVRPPWRTGNCCECRRGNVRWLPGMNPETMDQELEEFLADEDPDVV